MAKVFISGGGTGGHFYPAIAVSKKLKQKGFEVVYIGTKTGIEAEKDFPYGEKVLFEMQGVRGRGFFGKLTSSLKLLKTVFKVYRLIKREKPLFSVCFGGYTSFPLGFASFLAGIPLFIHEQNSVPSYTNIALSRFSKKVFITFHYSSKYFPKNRVVLTGMPLRDEIVEYSKKSSQKTEVKNILVVGGSQGAKRLNQVAIEVATHLPHIMFTLVKGKHEIGEKFPPNIKVIDYADNIYQLYLDADLVISRAGSGVVNELLAFGKYTVYVPYPYAASNHQYYNVKFLEDLGLSKVILEEDLTALHLKQIIEQVSALNLVDISQKLKRLAKLDASDSIVNTILEEVR